MATGEAEVPRPIIETRRAPTTSRWLVRFGYEGSAFRGWARQPGLRTVEGEIRRGLLLTGVTEDPTAPSLAVASRTDRGVSARGNALTLRSALPGPTLLRSLNGIDRDIFFTAASPVPEAFRVRRAVRRTYRYFEASSAENPGLREEAARLFAGAVDVRSFGRSIPPEAPAWRTVESVLVRPLDGGSLVEVRAPAFVWGMVRKIVAALRAVDSGRLSLPRLRSALEGGLRLTLPMAEPEPLVLWEVEYDLPWTFVWRGPNRAQLAAARDRRQRLWCQQQLLETWAELPGVDRPPP